MEPTSVLITGGAGFIGANLCRRLTANGSCRVTVLDDFSTGSKDNLVGLDVQVVEASILDAEAVAAAVPQGGTVVHLAALGSVPRSVADPLHSHDVNTTGTLHVLEAARNLGIQQVIFASSSSVYGNSDAPAKHELLPTRPLSPYGASKLAAESYLLAYQHTYGLPALAFRFFNVFGPLQAAGHAYAAVVPTFIDRALAHEPLTIHGDGTQSRDFTFVDTVCDTIADAIDRRVVHEGPVNLAFGTQVSLLDVVALLESGLGRPLERQHVSPRAGDIRHSKADPALLRRLFPAAVPVAVGDGIRATLDWFRQNPGDTRR